MACTIWVVRDGLQCSLVRTFQVLRVATARSPRARTRHGICSRPSAGVKPRPVTVSFQRGANGAACALSAKVIAFALVSTTMMPSVRAAVRLRAERAVQPTPRPGGRLGPQLPGRSCRVGGACRSSTAPDRAGDGDQRAVSDGVCQRSDSAHRRLEVVSGHGEQGDPLADVAPGGGQADLGPGGQAREGDAVA